MPETVPFDASADALRAAADALRPNDLVNLLTQTTDDELRQLHRRLENAQRYVRALLRELAAIRRRDTAQGDAEKAAAGIVSASAAAGAPRYGANQGDFAMAAETP